MSKEPHKFITARRSFGNGNGTIEFLAHVETGKEGVEVRYEVERFPDTSTVESDQPTHRVTVQRADFLALLDLASKGSPPKQIAPRDDYRAPMPKRESPPISMRRMKYGAASRHTGIPEGTLRSLVSMQAVPHIRLGARSVLFDIEQLDAWMAERAVKPKAKVTP